MRRNYGNPLSLSLSPRMLGMGGRNTDIRFQVCQFIMTKEHTKYSLYIFNKWKTAGVPVPGFGVFQKYIYKFFWASSSERQTPLETKCRSEP